MITNNIKQEFIKYMQALKNSDKIKSIERTSEHKYEITLANGAYGVFSENDIKKIEQLNKHINKFSFNVILGMFPFVQKIENINLNHINMIDGLTLTNQKLLLEEVLYTRKYGELLIGEHFIECIFKTSFAHFQSCLMFKNNDIFDESYITHSKIKQTFEQLLFIDKVD